VSRSFIVSSVAAATFISALVAIAPASAGTVRADGVETSLHCVVAERGPYFFPAPDWGPFFRRVKHVGPIYRYCEAASERRAVISVKY
jgi:hypothetical protein